MLRPLKLADLTFRYIRNLSHILYTSSKITACVFQTKNCHVNWGVKQQFCLSSRPSQTRLLDSRTVSVKSNSLRWKWTSNIFFLIFFFLYDNISNNKSLIIYLSKRSEMLYQNGILSTNQIYELYYAKLKKIYHCASNLLI